MRGVPDLALPRRSWVAGAPICARSRRFSVPRAAAPVEARPSAHRRDRGGGPADHACHVGRRHPAAGADAGPDRTRPRYHGGVSELSYLAFDADNHYYEALDAFTRHVEP